MRKTVIERAALYLGNVGVCLGMGLEGMKWEVGAFVVAKGFYNSRDRGRAIAPPEPDSKD